MPHYSQYGLNTIFNLMNDFKLGTIKSNYVVVCDYCCLGYLVIHIISKLLITVGYLLTQNTEFSLLLPCKHGLSWLCPSRHSYFRIVLVLMC